MDVKVKSKLIVFLLKCVIIHFKGEKRGNMTRKDIFHTNLRKLIDNSGKSQAEIADAIGEKYTTFNMWAVGGTMPRADKLQKIADYFHVGLDELLNEDHNILIRTDLAITIDELEGLDSDQLARIRDYIRYIKYEGGKR